MSNSIGAFAPLGPPRRRGKTRGRARSVDGAGEFLWLVSLSDLMILLFVFFVVMFSFAYQKFGNADFRRMGEMLAGSHADAASEPLDEVQAKLLKWVVDRKLLKDVEVDRKQDSLILEIKEKLLFDSGSADLKSQSRELIGLISSALVKVPAPYRIGIEGHTDDSPIAHAPDRKTAMDNWQLSTERARAVLLALSLPDDLRRRALILGYGEMSPLVPNRDASGHAIPENQARNRRVTVRIF